MAQGFSSIQQRSSKLSCCCSCTSHPPDHSNLTSPASAWCTCVYRITMEMSNFCTRVCPTAWTLYSKERLCERCGIFRLLGTTPESSSNQCEISPLFSLNYLFIFLQKSSLFLSFLKPCPVTSFPSQE